MALATLCMACMDATSKYLVARYPAPFVVWIRYALQTLVLVAVLAPRMRGRLVATRSLSLQIVRSVTLVATSLLLVAAFRAMPLADATAISFAAPSIVTILAIALLGERVTMARVASVVAGFAGVVLIVRPGTDVFRGAALLPLIAATTTAAYQVLTRKLAGDDTRAMLFYSSAVGAVILSLFLPWRGFAHDFGAGDVVAMAALGLLAIAGHFLFIRALQLAPASGMASITYVQLVFATLIGLVVFGDFPDALTLVGMAVILASGVFLTWYERRRSGAPVVSPVRAATAASPTRAPPAAGD
ncbi:MAG TPA: DMT family transporter [Casimicrobiaceae bacterium]|nr:DMT family transporter [Casimicrobiaceae bacterium]